MLDRLRGAVLGSASKLMMITVGQPMHIEEDTHAAATAVLRLQCLGSHHHPPAGDHTSARVVAEVQDVSKVLVVMTRLCNATRAPGKEYDEEAAYPCSNGAQVGHSLRDDLRPLRNNC